MKFNFNDFLELDTNGLLAVNGGYYCNGSSPSTTSYPNTYYPTGGGGSGGGSDDGLGSAKIIGGECSKSNLPDRPKKDDGKDSSSPITSPGTCSNINLGDYYKQNEQKNKDPVFEGMKKSIENNNDKKYVIGVDGYMCDNWVAEVLRDAGHDVEYYFNGDENDTVQDHIDALKDGAYSKEVPTEKGVYVVFMNDSNNYIPHAGLLVVEGDGSMYMWDNSSGNSTGGVESTKVSKYSDTKISGYGYNSYYFQKVTNAH